jgi:hypothetical protein
MNDSCNVIENIDYCERKASKTECLTNRYTYCRVSSGVIEQL